MPKIQWSEQLSLGVEQIDSQHKELIAIANELIEAVLQGQSKDSVDDVVKRLREYTVFHFKSEEELMEEIRYPRRGEQMQEHKRLKREVKEYQRQIYRREEVTPEAILEFIKDWLLKHILAYDRDLAGFIHGQEAEKTIEKIDESEATT